MHLSELQRDVHALAKAKGWWDGGERNIGECLALIHSEVSEALEEWRSGKGLIEIHMSDQKPEGFPVELADVIIRVLDLAEKLHIDLETAILIKHGYNETRPYRHGGKIA